MNAPLIIEYLPKYAHVLLKRAAPLEYQGEKDLQMMGRELPKRPGLHALKTVGKGLMGMGAGTLAGYGLAGALHKHSPIDTKYLVPASALLGGGLALAHSLWKARELKELQRAFEAHRSQRSGGISQ